MGDDLKKTEKVVEKIITELEKLYVDQYFEMYLPMLIDRYRSQVALLQQQTRAHIIEHKEQEKQQHVHDEALKKENESLKEQLKQLETNTKQLAVAAQETQDAQKVVIRSNEDQIKHLRELLPKLDSLPPAELITVLGPIFLVEHRMHSFNEMGKQWEKLINVHVHGKALVENVIGMIRTLLTQTPSVQLRQKLLGVQRELEGLYQLWSTILPDKNTEFMTLLENFQQMEAILVAQGRDLMEAAHKGQKDAVRKGVNACIPLLAQEHELLKEVEALALDMKDHAKEYGKMIAEYKAQLLPNGILHNLLHHGS